MKLKPSWKEKRRYLLIKIENIKGKSNLESLKNRYIEKIKKSLLDLIGIINYAKARPLFIKIKQIYERPLLIISVNHKYLSHLRTALVLANLSCIYVSGTLKKLKKIIEKDLE